MNNCATEEVVISADKYNSIYLTKLKTRWWSDGTATKNRPLITRNMTDLISPYKQNIICPLTTTPGELAIHKFHQSAGKGADTINGQAHF